MRILKNGFTGGCIVLLIAVLLSPALFAQGRPNYVNAELCTQGYFAVLLCEYARLDVRESWTPEKAIEELESIGIEPLE